MKALCFFDILHKISSSLLVKMLDKRKTGGLAENIFLPQPKKTRPPLATAAGQGGAPTGAGRIF